MGKAVEEEQLSLFDPKAEKREVLDLISAPLQVKEEEIVLLSNQEVFQPPIPSDVLKNRSNLMSDVIKTELMETIEMDSSEDSNLYPLNVTTRFSVSYEEYEGLEISTSLKLTQFDREVIDAVASLASYSKILSPATIYRVITGKRKNFTVSKKQKEKVAESIRKCGLCRIAIDVTEELQSNNTIGQNEKISYHEYLISYAEIRHRTPNGVNSYYEILKMPPLFRFAESIGKISSIPLALVDTPVNKTDSALSVQSFLFRSIEEMKQNGEESIFLEWETIYQYAEINQNSRTQANRMRDAVGKILEYWKENTYIGGYDLSISSKGKKIDLLKIEGASVSFS